MKTERIAALIPAAGCSARMGAFKPLLPVGDKTVLETVIALYRSAGIFDIFVVLGHRAKEIQPILDKLDVISIFNKRFELGMFSSVQTGVKRISGLFDAFFLHPADMPGHRSETISRLVAARRKKDALVLHPCHKGRRGHPPLISTALIPAILAFDEPGGMRTFLSLRHDGVRHVECNDPGIFADLDTPDDYRKLAGEKSTGALELKNEVGAFHAGEEASISAEMSLTPSSSSIIKTQRKTIRKNGWIE